MFNLRLFWYFIVVVFVTTVITSLFIIFNDVYFNFSFKIDPDLASNFGEFFGGFIGTIFAALSILLLIYSINTQNIENSKTSIRNNFFKMIDYHRANVELMKVPEFKYKTSDSSKEDSSVRKEFLTGTRVFVEFKKQIRLIYTIINVISFKKNLKITESQKNDLVYHLFYYGFTKSKTWRAFVEQKLSHIDECRIILDEYEYYSYISKFDVGRSNHTFLSSYYKNMYNAIKMIDSCPFFTDDEKKNQIKIYRAQLSNPELYVLFYNVISSLGKQWCDSSSNLIVKYELLKNIPMNYVENVDVRDYFDLDYDDIN